MALLTRYSVYLWCTNPGKCEYFVLWVYLVMCPLVRTANLAAFTFTNVYCHGGK